LKIYNPSALTLVHLIDTRSERERERTLELAAQSEENLPTENFTLFTIISQLSANNNFISEPVNAALRSKNRELATHNVKIKPSD